MLYCVPLGQVSGRKFPEQSSTDEIPCLPVMLGSTNMESTRRAVLNSYMSFPLSISVWTRHSLCAALVLLTPHVGRAQAQAPGKATKSRPTELTALPGFKVEKLYS